MQIENQYISRIFVWNEYYEMYLIEGAESSTIESWILASVGDLTEKMSQS